MSFDDLLRKARETGDRFVNDRRGQVEEGMSAKMGEISGLGPLLARAGWPIDRIEVALAVVPEIKVGLVRLGSADTSLEELLERDDLSTSQRMFLGAIQKAFQANQKMGVRHQYDLDRIEVELSVNPKVILHLRSMNRPVDPILE